MASISIRNVIKRFGETTVLVGPSGCGKSTLLRIPAGLENISGGEIAIDAKVVSQAPPKERVERYVSAMTGAVKE